MAQRPINAQTLTDIFTGFQTRFRGGFAGVSPLWSQIATEVPSTTRTENYSWLGKWPKIREWIGDRVIKQLSAQQYSITNKSYESTISVERDDISDDQLGIYGPMFEELGQTTAAFPDELIFPMLANGNVAKCYDGQPFFDNSHPVADGLVANDMGGAGTAWYLMCTTRALKPLIWQPRQSFDLNALDKPTDPNVFMRKQFIYGVDGRGNAGFGFWQMAIRSKQTLDATNYEAARAAMMAFKDDEGKPLGLKPNLLLAPGTLEGPALRLLNRAQVGGSDNEWYKTADPVIAPLL
jgi:phage major head subunit gpT-like protein